jgi:hypothetical protein
MGKLQRQRGAQYERDIVNDLFVILGYKTRRNLVQYQESGEGDIILYEFMEQAEASCKEGQTPIVVMRADGEKSLALVRWEDMLKFLGNELPPAQPEVHPSPKDGD